MEKNKKENTKENINMNSEESTEEKRILGISPSGLDVFISCPRKYHYRYTANIREPELREKTSLKWLEINEKGNLIHKAMELYVNEYIRPLSSKLDTPEAPKRSPLEKQILDELDKLDFSEEEFQKAWEKAVVYIDEQMQGDGDEAVEIPLSAKEKELIEYEQEGREALKNLHEKMKINRQYPVYTELRFGKNSTDDESSPIILSRKGQEDFEIRGSIDRVDYDAERGKYVVVDYKTGSFEKKNKLRTTDRDDLIQDRMYALAFEKLFKGKEIMASRYIFTASDNREIYTKIDSKSKKEFEDRLWKEIESIREKKDVKCSGDTEKYPECEDTCKYCCYRELCESYVTEQAGA